MKRFVSEPGEAVELVKPRRRVVERMHHNGRRADPLTEAERDIEGLKQKDAAGTLALEVSVEGEASDEEGRRRVVRAQIPVLVTATPLSFRKRIAIEREVTDDPADRSWICFIDEDICGSRAFVFIPINGVADVEIKGRLSAMEAALVMKCLVVPFDRKISLAFVTDGLAHRTDERNRFSQRAAARSIAAFGGGGFSIAATSAAISRSESSR